ncbi:MAG: hypothetical protein ACLU3F_11115 [Blautia wexlerae]
MQDILNEVLMSVINVGDGGYCTVPVVTSGKIDETDRRQLFREFVYNGGGFIGVGENRPDISGRADSFSLDDVTWCGRRDTDLP